MDMRSNFSQHTLSANETLKEIDNLFKKNGDTKQFLESANAIIHNGTVYKWPEAMKQVPITENWILWFCGYLGPVLNLISLTDVKDLFESYQFFHYEKALQRGFGICSQLAILTADLLTHRYDVKTYVVGLDGHVVSEAITSQGEKYVLDPAYGIFLPFGIKDAETRLYEVSEIYKTQPIGKVNPTTNLHATAELYNKEGTTIREKPGGYGYAPKLYYIEYIAYVLKWILPVSLLLISLILWYRNRKNSI